MSKSERNQQNAIQRTSNVSNQYELLGVPRFRPLFWTQFLGAFNDNLFKNALVVLLTFQTAQWTSLRPEILANLAAGLFILPFFLFSATAGQLADKYDKALLSRLTKLLEVAIMFVAIAGFFLHSLSILLGALFLLGLQSALFGPVIRDPAAASEGRRTARRQRAGGGRYLCCHSRRHAGRWVVCRCRLRSGVDRAGWPAGGGGGLFRQ